jgi:hypothetical protein
MNQNLATAVFVHAVAVLVEINGTRASEHLADENPFGDGWAPRHNQDIWVVQNGMYEALPPPYSA